MAEGIDKDKVSGRLNDVCSQELLKLVAQKTCGTAEEWGRALRLESWDIHTITMDYAAQPNGYREKLFKMFQIWKERRGSEATALELLAAAYELKHVATMEEIQNHLCPGGPNGK